MTVSGSNRLAPARSPALGDADDTSVVWPGSRSEQRALMRVLRGRLGDDADAVCFNYARAERIGRVKRMRGAEHIEAVLHARLLWREGLLRGWLRP